LQHSGKPCGIASLSLNSTGAKVEEKGNAICNENVGWMKIGMNNFVVVKILEPMSDTTDLREPNMKRQSK
jgi:hypothetical protein